jgi:hypothetical protein
VRLGGHGSMMFLPAAPRPSHPQTPSATALHPAAEPAVGRYAKCLSDQFQERVAKDSRNAMAAAVDACMAVRVAAISQADLALREVPSFADRVTRQSYLRSRFDAVDAMMREVGAGGMDPAKWE